MSPDDPGGFSYRFHGGKDGIQMKKTAVLVPGIGYTCDRPLLHFAGKLAAAEGYDVVKLSFRHLGGKKNLIGDEKKMREVFEKAYEQMEEQLDFHGLSSCDEILFISKSIGTAAAAAYEAHHRTADTGRKLNYRHVYYTPVAGTFEFMAEDSGIAFHGTKDPWVDDRTVEEGCRRCRVPLTEIDQANHSLETGDVMRDIDILRQVMRETASYLGHAASEQNGTPEKEGDSLPVWKVVRIEEADYGCEELPDQAEVQVRVILDDGKGVQRAVTAPDRMLYRLGIDEGSMVTLSGGELKPFPG